MATLFHTNNQWRDRLKHVDYAYQPIVNIHTGVCFGFEALLRDTGRAGFDSIDALFNQAFEDGVLYQVDLSLRKMAIEKFSRPFFRKQMRLFFNLDNRVLFSQNYTPGNTTKIMDELGVPKDTLCFEISEKHQLLDAQKSFTTLEAYRRQGFKIAVDDCGTGFSGLQLLYYAEPDFIKIDRFFVQDIAGDPKKRLVVSSIVNIAHIMGATVVAEGVETKKEYYACRDIGCDLIQGYLVQKPTQDISQLKDRYDQIRLLSEMDRREGSSNSDHALINTEMEQLKPILIDAQISSVFEEFRNKTDYPFFPVVNKNMEPVGIIREASFKDYAYSRYGQELLQNPAFGKNLERFVDKFPIADIHTSIEKVLETYSQNEYLEGIFIVENMRYVGFLSARSLLRVLNNKNLAIARDQNPLTKLPGNTLIHEYVAKALTEEEAAFALVYFDFDNFKPYNDRFGFRHGDRVIQLFSDILKARSRTSSFFAGHVGGDDFFLGIRGMDLARVREIVTSISDQFKRDVESFYDSESIQLGYIISRSRSGEKRKFPLLTVSAVVVELPSGQRDRLSMEHISNHIARHKKKAKLSPEGICISCMKQDSEKTGGRRISRSPQPRGKRRQPALHHRQSLTQCCKTAEGRPRARHLYPPADPWALARGLTRRFPLYPAHPPLTILLGGILAKNRFAAGTLFFFA